MRCWGWTAPNEWSMGCEGPTNEEGEQSGLVYIWNLGRADCLALAKYLLIVTAVCGSFLSASCIGSWAYCLAHDNCHAFVVTVARALYRKGGTSPLLFG